MMAPLGPVLEIVGKLRSTKSACCLKQKDTRSRVTEKPAENQGPPSLTELTEEIAQGSWDPRQTLTCEIPQLCQQLRSLSHHLWAPNKEVAYKSSGVINHVSPTYY